MAILRLVGGVGLLAGALLAAQGCSSSESTGEQSDVAAEDMGSVSIELKRAPNDAACLRLTADGATTVAHTFDLTPGQASTLSMGGLPLGQVVFTAEAFSSACASVTAQSIATYNSDAVTAMIQPNITASIALGLHTPGSANVAVDFPSCDGTAGEWNGCRGNGCSVCTEKLTEFPRYVQNHPNCVANSTCQGQFFQCNAACPAPTDADREPEQCMGSPGGWNGCRGNGCAVCTEQLTEFPLYLQNHPTCAKNDTCAGQFFQCNSACPAPTDADRLPGSATNIYVEAESGTFNAPLVSVSDATASGGKYLWSGTSSTTATTPPTTGHATYGFKLSSAQTIKVWGRFFVGAGGTGDDSLYVRMDAGVWSTWNDISNRVGGGFWAWDSSHDSPNNPEKTWALAAGDHTLEVAYREDGLRMDRFLVTSDLLKKPQ